MTKTSKAGLCLGCLIIVLTLFASKADGADVVRAPTDADKAYKTIVADIYPAFDSEKCGETLKRVLEDAAETHTTTESFVRASPERLERVARLAETGCVDKYFSVHTHTTPLPAPKCAHMPDGRVPAAPIEIVPIDPEFTLVKLKDFHWYSSGCSDFSAIIQKMARAVATELHALDGKGVILDLRGNLGGFVDAVVGFLDAAFSPAPGRLVITEQGVRRKRTAEKTKSLGIARCPMAVLVNRDTASAAEIAAGTIRQWCKDTSIVGERTRGKGVVNVAMHVKNATIMYSFAQYYIGDDLIAINGRGIEPDISVGETTFVSFASRFDAATRPVGYDDYVEAAVRTVRLRSYARAMVARDATIHPPH